MSTVQMILLSKIEDPEWNSRLGDAEDKQFAGLCESIDAEGLLNPLVVEPSQKITVVKGEEVKDYFTLVAGSRRRRAVIKLGWKEVPCTVREPSSVLERTIVNAAENFQRKDLTTFEQARAFAEIRREALAQEARGGEKVTINTIAKKLGVSFSTVQWQVQAYETLPAEIKDHWMKGDAVMTAAFIQELVRLKDPDKQIAHYKGHKKLMARLTAGESDNPANKSGTRNAKGKGKKNKNAYSFPIKREKELRQALDAARRKKTVVPSFAFINDVIDWIIGESATVDGLVFDEPVTNDAKGGKKGKKS